MVLRGEHIEVGDLIMKVRQEDEKEAVSVVGMRLDDAVKLIKGPKGTKVILTIKRVDGSIEDETIMRDVVELEETYAKSTLIKKDDKKFGVINLPKFYIDFHDYSKRNAASDIKKEIIRLPYNDPEILFDFSQWWRWIKGANWKQPNGPGSTNCPSSVLWKKERNS